MIEYKSNPNDNVVELLVEGKITEADFVAAMGKSAVSAFLLFSVFSSFRL